MSGTSELKRNHLTSENITFFLNRDTYALISLLRIEY